MYVYIPYSNSWAYELEFYIRIWAAKIFYSKRIRKCVTNQIHRNSYEQKKKESTKRIDRQ